MNQIIWEDMQQIEKAEADWSWLYNSSVLVSGAYGMLASYMVFFLIYLNETDPHANIQILAQGRNSEKMRRRFGPYVGRDYFHFLECDICGPLHVEGPVDYIVHAASLASPQYYREHPVDTLLPNVFGTARLLELARDKRARGVLFFSSGDVYGQVPPEADTVRETTLGLVDPMALRSCYGESKRMGETMCVAWHQQYGVPVKSVRICHTYGPTCDPWHDERVFAEFVGNIVDGRDIEMKSDGSATRPFCYLSDATDAFFRILRYGNAGEAYNMGNFDCLISIRDLANLLVSLFPERGLKVHMQARPAGAVYMESPVKQAPNINTDKLRALGWAPRVPLGEGFRRTVESFLIEDAASLPGGGLKDDTVIWAILPVGMGAAARCRCAR